MRKKILIVAMIFLFAAAGWAEDKVIRHEWGVKAVRQVEAVLEEPSMSSQALQRERPRVVLLATYIADDTGTQFNSLNLASTDEILFYVDYIVIFNTQVKLHFTMTGPEFYEAWTEEWMQAKYNNYYYYTLATNTNWKKGIYKLIVTAEQKIIGSGAECVAECVFELY
ncbi:MAG: hypothetical protein JXB23_12975 [Candidatus Aminicenantes bacterium]|nr:hypothetical protein [Candidatus Aminicenantes bacterium]